MSDTPTSSPCMPDDEHGGSGFSDNDSSDSCDSFDTDHADINKLLKQFGSRHNLQSAEFDACYQAAARDAAAVFQGVAGQAWATYWQRLGDLVGVSQQLSQWSAPSLVQVQRR